MTTTPIRKTPPERATGPVDCEPWCDDGHGHPRETFAADQYCYTVVAHLALSNHEWDMNDDVTAPAEAMVRTVRHPGEKARVVLVNQDDRETALTPQEARDLAGWLTHFAWVADQGGRERNAFEIGRDYERGLRNA